MQFGRNKELTRTKEFGRDRKKKGQRRYGQAKYKHSKKGMLSLIVAGITFTTLLALIITAFLLNGQSAAIIGSFGIFTMIISGMGVLTGIRGFRERDKNYLTCKIGAAINGIVMVLLIIIFIRGII